MIKKTESFIVYHGINGLHDTYDTFRHATITLVILWKKETLHQFSLKTLKWHQKRYPVLKFAIPEIWNILEKWHVCTLSSVKDDSNDIK